MGSKGKARRKARKVAAVQAKALLLGVKLYQTAQREWVWRSLDNAAEYGKIAYKSYHDALHAAVTYYDRKGKRS